MAGTLVILRHGESTWNETNLFTGWHDVPLTVKLPAAVSASPTVNAIAPVEVSSSVPRSTRSEINPPMIERNNDGASWQATMMPTNVALFVSENA